MAKAKKTTKVDVSSVAVDTELKVLADTASQVSQALASVSASVTDRVNRIKELDEAIKDQVEHLNNLHNLDVLSVTKEELEVQIEELRKTHEVERRRLDRDQKNTIADFESDVKRKRQLLEVELRERREDFLKEVEANKSANDLLQEELISLKEEVADFSNVLKSEVKKAEAILENRLKRDYEHDKKVTELEHNNSVNLLKNELLAATKRNTELESELNRVREELTNVRREANEVVSRAVEAGANRNVLDMMSRTQETTRSK